MSKNSKDFTTILENGSAVDDIFKDEPMPLGSNPFSEKTEITKPIEVSPDDDEDFSSNRSNEIYEKLIPLFTRDDMSFGEVVSEILNVAMKSLYAEAGSLIEVDYQNKCLFFRAVTGNSSKNLLNFTIPEGQGVVGFVCETQQPLVLSQIEDSAVYLKTISDSVGFEAKNLMAYPIVIRGKTFGCIEILNRVGQLEFSDEDKEVMQTVCFVTNLIIENRLIKAAITAKNQAEVAA